MSTSAVPSLSAEEDVMADQHEDGSVDAQEVLRSFEDVRSRLRTAIWALHGMHQDMAALTVDDLADLEQLLTETLDHILTPAYEAVSQMLGAASGGAVTTH
jgi:muconolactone delta-isomerase